MSDKWRGRPPKYFDRLENATVRLHQDDIKRIKAAAAAEGIRASAWMRNAILRALEEANGQKGGALGGPRR